MSQLPLITDPSMMQTKWKSILDPIVKAAGAASDRQVEVGSLQTVNGTTASASFAAPSHTISVSFKANTSGLYRVYTSNYVMSSSTAGAAIASKIVATFGAPTLRVPGQANITTTAGYATTGQNAISMTSIYELVKGTEYTFELQGQTDAGTLTFAFATTNAAMIAEEL